MPALSVIIPTHNPRPAVLRRVLTHLRDQTLTASEWEAVLVDNASDPEVDAAACSALLPGIRIVREPKMGLLYARIAGINATSGHTIVFVDDDNLLDLDYLRTAKSFLCEHPEVGVVGGRIAGEFAHIPPRWAEPHLASLAVRDFGGNALISNHRSTPSQYDYFAPVGAGMVIRAEYCRKLVASVGSGETRAIGRCGKHLAGCEDCDLIAEVWMNGSECAYTPALRLTHVIPEVRLSFRYLQRLARQGGESWGEFLGRNGFAAPIPRWSVALRQAKAAMIYRAWTRCGFISWRRWCGYYQGLARTTRDSQV